MPSIGFHTRITNPLSMGYLAYLACIDSWRRIADKVVVVDGGSNDGSIELLRDWIGHDPKVKILSNDLSHWGTRFAWEQSTLNMQLGHDDLAACDWIIRADADHVVDGDTADQLLEELQTHFPGHVSVAFDVYSFWNGEYRRRAAPRNWIINNQAAKSQGLHIGWGKDELDGLLSDAPLKITRQIEFVDPETGVVKPLLIGVPLDNTGLCSIKVYRYGHFFFSRKQCLTKCKLWDDAVVRFMHKYPKCRLEILLDADVVGIVGFVTRNSMLSRWHPAEARRLIAEFYQPGMLGGAEYAPGIGLALAGLRGILRVQHGLTKLAQLLAGAGPA